MQLFILNFLLRRDREALEELENEIIYYTYVTHISNFLMK